jgi:dimethylargininase
MLIAHTRAVSPRLAECELTHLDRQPLDSALAMKEHEAYEALLAELGAEVRRLSAEPELPDGVFVEDTAVVLEEIAIITRPGAPSRRPETRSVAMALAANRPIAHIASPATLDGGDVLVTGRRIYVGRSTRSNRQAADQLAATLRPFGYEVIPVGFSGCLHLKSAVTEVADDLLLLNPDWVDAAAFKGYRAVSVDAGEPHAANALRIGDALIHPSHHTATRRRLESEGLRVVPVAMKELAKAEAGVTCCSLLLEHK